MTNIKTEIKGDQLIIRVDLKEDHGPSKSGKTIIIATSHGFNNIEENGHKFGLSLNVTKRK